MSPLKAVPGKKRKRSRTKALFRVVGRLDGAGRAQEGTLTIDRKSGLVSVRPLRRRRDYTLLLSTVAEIVVARVIKAELAEKRSDQARRRHRRPGAARR